jgi:quercetin dioxygenase-like cupin family protein
METRKVLVLVVCVLLWAGAAFAQDPVKVSPEIYKAVVDNASVRVLRVSVPVGGKTAMHQHPDHIVIPLTAGKVRFTGPDGKSQDAELPVESATFTPAGAHMGANTGTTAVDAIVIEFKSAAPGKATLPPAREGLAMKVLSESPRAMVYRSTADPKFQEAAGTKHEYDQVVIALAPTQMSLAVDGKPAKTSWARGDVQFIGRGIAHESKNASGKTVDFIIVAIR